MSRMLLAPGRYIQGVDAINEIGSHAAKMGSKALLTGGKRALSFCSQAIQASLTENGIGCHQEEFMGECSDNEINRLVEVGKANGADLVICAGGGKVIDTGKAVAYEMKVPVIVVPTIAATDAPCSALSVIYTDDGVFSKYLVLPTNPDCVLVDTGVVAQAPVNYLVSGMGDALATFWEADTCAKSCKPNALTGATPANTLLSGLGFESGGLAGSHSVHNGFTVLEASHGKLHGQKVAFGTLTQLVLEGRPSEDIYEVLDFCLSVGLPICLEELGLSNPTQEEIRQVAEATTAEGETIHSTWFPVTASMVEAAIWTADALGQEFKKEVK
ncbi:MAG: glycerol dehydrogenase [Deltaproteobacteria bacterium]|nr:glycerol dehydrogenase [Deltaproteobacteria bacterium]